MKTSNPQSIIKTKLLASLAGFVLLAGTLPAQVPQLINYQGRVAVGGVNFEGTGQFKFQIRALNADATATYCACSLAGFLNFP